MRLLVSFAGALRKWARSIEPTTDEPAPRRYRDDREDRFDGDVAGRVGESRRASAPSGPPEHWARLVASAPPDHWLDLIRAKAPHLLSPEGELLAAESDSVQATAEDAFDGPRSGPYGGSRDGALETDPDWQSGEFAGNTATGEQSTPQQRLRGRRQRPADSNPQVSAKNWLNRLRFRPPKQRPAHVESQYPDSGATTSVESRDSSSEDDRVAADRESRSSESDRYEQSRKLTTNRQRDRNAATSGPATSMRYPSDESNETAAGRGDREIYTTGESRRRPVTAASQDSLRHDPKAQTSSAASSEAQSLKTVDDVRQRRASNAATIVVKRPETNSATARSADRLQNSDFPEQYRRSRDLNRELSGDSATSRDANFAAARRDEYFSSRNFRQLNAERSGGANRQAATERELSSARDTALRNARRTAVETSREAVAINATGGASSQSHSAGPLTKEATTIAATRQVEHARHRFASTDFAAPALTESHESMWPTLPPSRNFALADELVALEREAETLRRLDREQRGTLWNA